ncbi:D-inositol-3-phosphate glycosyltransferase [Candidatus Methanoperedenaceae archaeon GB37]|nr:D-inositol-3-phosphate glycosyltransferase [Candidatus Methanoperedenaceae archaeon GB37]
MKVMIIHHQMGVYGGAETLVTKLSTYLTNKGIENAILALSKPPEAVEECNDLQIITPNQSFEYKNWSVSFSDAIQLVNEVLALRKLYREHVDKFDLVNVHNFPAIWSIFPKRKPCVWMCNEPPDLWYDSDNNHSSQMKVLRAAFLSVNKFMVNRYIDSICVSDKFNAKRAFTRYNKQPEIIPYGIEYELFSKGDSNRAISMFGLDDSFILLQVGIISKSKNQLASVKAVEELRKHIPNIKLVLAGLNDNGPYDKMIKEYVNNKGLQECVIFTGHQHKEVLRDLYHACDIALFPIKTQGGWLSPFEALSASKPIIVSTEMTAADIIARERIGVVTDNIVKAVLEIHNNPNPFHIMAGKGRRFVAENLSWDKFCQNMLTVFENTLAQRTNM